MLRARRIHTLAATSVALVVAVVAVALAVTESGAGRDPVARVVTDAPATTEAVAPTDQADLAATTLPLATRGESAIVWTGREIVVWGGDIEGPNVGLPALGDASFADGAAFDPATGTWRTMAEGPLPAIERTPRGVWAGERVVIARDRQIAAWDPATDTWMGAREMPAAAIALAPAGDDVLVVGPDVIFEPRTGDWRELSDAPAAITMGKAFWTGSEVIVIGATQTPGEYQGDAAAYAYDPEGGAWRTLPPSGIHAQSLDAAWTGREIVVVEYNMHAVAYDPENDVWRALPDIPARMMEGGPHVESAGGQVVVEMFGTLLLLDADDQWIPLQLPRDGHAGEQWFRTGERLWRATIDRATATSVLAPFATPDVRQIQVGVFSLDLPDGVQFAGASHDRGPEGYDNIVVVEVTSAEGDCTLRGTHRGPPFSDVDGAVIAELSGSDHLVASCDPPELAAVLAEAVQTPEFG